MSSLRTRPLSRGASRRLLLALVAVLPLLVIGAILLHGILRQRRQSTAALSQSDAEAIREHNAAAIFRSAKSAAEAGNWPLAHAELARLKEDWSHTRFYAGHRAAIEALAKAIEDAPVADALQPPAPAEPPAPAPLPAEPWRRRIAEAMRRHVTFSFEQRSPEDMTNFLAAIADITIVLDPEVAKSIPPITLRIEDMAFEETLNRVCKMAGCTHMQANGAVLLTTEARAKDLAREADKKGPFLEPPPKALEEALAKTHNFDFAEIPLADILNFVASLIDLNIVPDTRAVWNAPEVTLRVNEMRLDHCLFWICRATGMAWVWYDVAMFVSSPQAIKATLATDEALRPFQQPPTKALAERVAKRIDLDFVETPWHQAAASLLKETGVVVMLDPAVMKDAPAITLRVVDMPADAAIRWCCRVSGMACLWRSKRLVITTPQRASQVWAEGKGK
ncbi:MAG: hypothetical protein FJ290_31800 [Planctomycetes bacterium]|nr:hypothetical protein [Planctomycetota bacterium]